MKRVRFAAVLIGVCACFPATAQQVSSELARFKSFKAEADPNLACGKEINVSVTASREEAFSAEADIGILLGAVIGNLQARCPAGPPNLKVQGLAAGKEVYRATYRNEGGWKLARLPLEPKTAETLAVATLNTDGSVKSAKEDAASEEINALIRDLEVIAKCDELAAHPDDAEALAPGVEDSKISAMAAKLACEKAIKIDPESPRLAFQLGRAILMLPDGSSQDHEAAALEYFVAAAEQEHGGALAYLGDYYLQGRGGIDPDPEAALGLYKRAAEAQFKPAEKFLSSVETSEVKEIEPEGWISRQWNSVTSILSSSNYTQEDELREGIVLEGYRAPKIVEAYVYRNDANADVNYKVTMMYSYSAATSYNNMCEEKISTQKLDKYEREMASISNITSAGWSVFTNYIINMAEFVKDPAHGANIISIQERMMDEIEEAPMQASEDIIILVERYGCDGAITRKFTEGLDLFLFSNEISVNFMDQTYKQKCKASEPKSLRMTYRNERSEYCDCVLPRLNSWPATLAHHKALLQDFQGTIQKLPKESGVSACMSGYWPR